MWSSPSSDRNSQLSRCFATVVEIAFGFRSLSPRKVSLRAPALSPRLLLTLPMDFLKPFRKKSTLPLSPFIAFFTSLILSIASSYWHSSCSWLRSLNQYVSDCPRHQSFLTLTHSCRCFIHSLSHCSFFFFGFVHYIHW